jgi:hypothetical protein
LQVKERLPASAGHKVEIGEDIEEEETDVDIYTCVCVCVYWSFHKDMFSLLGIEVS